MRGLIVLLTPTRFVVTFPLLQPIDRPMRPDNSRPQQIAFDCFVLDKSSGQLFKKGRRIRLQPQPFKLLEMMLERAGGVVTREEVCRALWDSDTFVDFDHSLGTAINKIREALGDSAERPRYVETLPRRGYRFVGTLKVAATDSDAAPEVIEAEPGEPPERLAVAETLGRVQQKGPDAPKRRRLGARILVGAVCVTAAISAYRDFRPVPAQQVLAAIPFTDYPGFEYCPAFSPDGSRIAFSWTGNSTEGRRTADLYVKVIHAEKVLQLTEHPSDSVCGVWSPDGTQIAFRRVAGPDTGIYMVSALGGPERKLLSTQGTRDISWSADGKWLAFSDSPGLKERPRVYLLALDNLERRQIPHDEACLEEFQPSFTHSGDRLAYACLLKATDNEIGIYITSAKGGTPKLVSKFSTGWDLPEGLAWSADDQRLIISRPKVGDDYELNEITADGKLKTLGFGAGAMEPAVSSRGERLAWMSYSSHVDIWRRDLLHPEVAATRVIASTYDQTSPEFSPDGKHIAFSAKRGGQWEIWISDADGNGRTKISDDKTSKAGSPRWSPDSRRLVFDSRQSGHTELYVVDIAERLPRKLATNFSEMSTPSWSWDGKWIYFQSTSGPRIFRCRVEGGEPQEVSGESGSYAFESPDGETVYFYSAAMGGKLRAVSTKRLGVAQEVKGMPAVDDQSHFAVIAGGIYFVPANDPRTVQYFDLNSGQVSKIFDVAQYHNNGLSVSPNKKWILYTQIAQPNSDIMLVENFH